MAAEDGADRTEQPTQRRRQEAREQGQVARSTDLAAAAALLGTLLLLNALGPGVLRQLRALVDDLADAHDTTADGLTFWLTRAAHATFIMLGPFLGLTLVISVAIGVTQTGGLFSTKLLKLKLDALDPVKGAQKLFSSEALMRLVTGSLKITLLAAVAWYTIRGQADSVLACGGLGAAAMLAVSAELIFTLGLRLGLVLLILGLADYFFQRWKLEQSLKMTKQEVRDELKNMEGDPAIKHRRRQLQARLALQRIHRDVPRANVVVTNPTEYAVALRYVEGEMDAPKVVAKGADLLALRIRQIAQQNGVPVVQRPPLARALYASVEIGQEVPPRFYRAVAELLAYVYQLSNRAAAI